MARRFAVGDVVGRFKIEKVLGQGSHGTFYEARRSEGSPRPIFLKGYSSPSPLVSWYSGYTSHQQGIWNRLRGSDAAAFTYRAIELFEHRRQYFQAIEMLNGIDLEIALARRLGTWEQRVVWARALTAGLAAFHAAGVIHCDLKPANVYMTPDDTIKAGHVVRLIDFDWAILADKPAPWHGEKDYVGSPNYSSPEHLRGDIPKPPSDVFTAALILRELLAQGHPYRSEAADGYREKALGHGAPVPALTGALPGGSGAFAAALERALDPDPSRRPTARALNELLNGR